MSPFNSADYSAGLVYARPEIFLASAACVILLLDLLIAEAQRRWTGFISVLVLIATAALVAVQLPATRVHVLAGMFELDWMAQVLKVVALLTVAVVFLYSTEYLRRHAILKGEYFVFGL